MGNGNKGYASVTASGFKHTDHNNNDAVLLAGGGYKALRHIVCIDTPYWYSDNVHYRFAFYYCNNLVWVDRHVKGSITTSFAIDPAVYPYPYDNDSTLNTTYTMTDNCYITINAAGIVTLKNTYNHKQRVGFFYTGRRYTD